MKHKILLVEDHPLMLQNYTTAFRIVERKLGEHILFDIETASNCQEAYESLHNHFKKEESFSIAIVDISIPSYPEKGMMSGEDISEYIFKNLPETKLIISTSLEDNFRLSSMIASLKPHGILIKSEIDGEDIVNTIVDVMSNKKSYSPKISKIIDNLTDNSTEYLDKIDRKILNEISMASRLVDMVSILQISRANIENRKNRMKEIFDVRTDRELLMEAKKRGFI